MILLLGIAGLLVGSHIAVIVTRWPDYRSAMTGRSRCDACGHVLTVRELVPLASMIAQSGRCRACAAPIAALHLQAEAGAMAIGMLAGLAPSLQLAVAGAVLGWQLLTLALLDARSLVLPDELTALLAAGGIVCAALGFGPAVPDCLIGGGGGYLCLAAIRHGHRALRGIEGMGGGDPKLLGAIGLWLGWRPLPALMLGAALIGLALVFVRRLRGVVIRADQPLPLGTFIAIAGYPSWLIAVAGMGPFAMR